MICQRYTLAFVWPLVFLNHVMTSLKSAKTKLFLPMRSVSGSLYNSGQICLNLRFRAPSVNVQSLSFTFQKLYRNGPVLLHLDDWWLDHVNSRFFTPQEHHWRHFWPILNGNRQIIISCFCIGLLKKQKFRWSNLEVVRNLPGSLLLN